MKGTIWHFRLVMARTGLGMKRIPIEQLSKLGKGSLSSARTFPYLWLSLVISSAENNDNDIFSHTAPLSHPTRSQGPAFPTMTMTVTAAFALPLIYLFQQPPKVAEHCPLFTY